jgi:phosphate ABC transporter phosphate-binding protein
MRIAVALFRLLACSVAVSSLSGMCLAQTAPSIRTVFVEPADASGSSQAVDQQLVHRIQKSGALRVVRDKANADAVLKVAAVIWPAGTFAPNPRSSTTVVSDYRGYASADLETRADQPLWSYLATPSRFHLGGAADDLASVLFDNLRVALKSGAIHPAETAANSPAAGALRVAGATFPAPLYRRWFESWAEASNTSPIAYDAVGSSAGLDLLAAGKIDLAASDIPASTVPDPSLLRFPTVIGGVVPIFNLAGVSRDLRLTPQLLADIYSGKVHTWSDPEIRRWNPGVRLPGAEIHVIHRSDGSGTSFVWTSFLATTSPAWKPLAGAMPQWPIGTGASGNDGVAAAVQSTPDAIGYVELTYAIQHHLSYAAVRNPAGQFMRADLASLTAAAESLHPTPASGMSLLNAPGVNTYPIATFTYFLVHTPVAASEQGSVTNFLRWMLTSGQKQCAALGYAPLPKALAEAELGHLQQLK